MFECKILRRGGWHGIVKRQISESLSQISVFAKPLRVCVITSVVCNLCTMCDLFSLCSLNRLCELPRGFGSFPALEILDLTYNNLTNSSFSANFSYLGECLRCLYMGDNDLTEFPPQIEKFVHLEIVSL